MIKGGIAIPAGSSKYLEAQPCPRNSLKLRVKLHSVENPPYIGIPFVAVSGFMGVIATW